MEAVVTNLLLGNSNFSQCFRLVEILGKKRSITRSGDELNCN